MPYCYTGSILSIGLVLRLVQDLRQLSKVVLSSYRRRSRLDEDWGGIVYNQIRETTILGLGLMPLKLWRRVSWSRQNKTGTN
jgi:hypothetical protein